MPKEEAGFPGYYLQAQVLRIVGMWLLPALAISAFGILQVLIPMPALVRWIIAVPLIALWALKDRFLNEVDRRIYSWRIGRDAEWHVRDALVAHLGDRFYLLNDLEIPGHGGNIDHVIVGPSGIHVVETKGVVGNIDATTGELVIRGYPKEEYLSTLKRRGEALRAFLRQELPGDSRTYPIYPVLVFTRASEVKSTGTTQGVCVEDVDGLLRLLDKYADRFRMDELHRAQVYRALRPHVASSGKWFIQRLGK